MKTTTGPKKVKLSPTMQKAMDKLNWADWYYMHDGKTCEYFATERGMRNVGFEGSGIVEGGLVYASMDSKTLKALEDRGLIEIKRDGGQCLDVVKVVGMELPERLDKVLMVKIVRRDSEGKYKPQTFIGYAVSEKAVKFLEERFSGKFHTIEETTILGEVKLDVWDFFKGE